MAFPEKNYIARPGEPGYQAHARSATFASGATKSSELSLRGVNSGAIHLPAEFDGDVISFEGAEKQGGTYAAIHNSGGALVQFTAAGGARWYDLPPEVFGCGWIKIVTGTATGGAATVLVSLRVGSAGPTSAISSIAAGENHIGQVGTGGNVVDVTPTCDTLIYAAGDVLFDSTEVANAVRVSGGRSELVSVVLIDEDDQAAAAMTLYFFRSNVSLGTFNAAPDISDADVREFQGAVALAAGDFVDVGGAKVATVKNVALMLEPTTGTSVWVAATTAGTPTQTASGIKLRLGFRYH